MVWARMAIAGGLLMVVAAFVLGTEDGMSTSVMGHRQECGASISSSWLVSGTPGPTEPAVGASAEERQVALACGPVVGESRAVVGTALGLGGLLALVGWTVIRGRREWQPRPVSPAHI